MVTPAGTATWTTERWIDVCTEQAALFRDAVGQAEPRATVPSCPGWTFAELVVHVGRFLHTVRRYFSSGSTVQLRPERPQVSDPLAFLDEELAATTPLLAGTPGNRPVWTFSPAAPDLAWVWHRRAAHELNLRRWDAQSALRTLQPTDRELAVDGIDELLGTLLAALQTTDTPPQVSGTAVVSCTDGPQAWFVRLAPGQAPDVRLAAEDEEADATLRNKASNLLYQLHGRMRLTGDGEAAILKALRMP